ncbi:MAG: hypothetical protein ACKVVT_13305 [Dehalococcoidia bacterium]
MELLRRHGHGFPAGFIATAGAALAGWLVHASIASVAGAVDAMAILLLTAYVQVGPRLEPASERAGVRGLRSTLGVATLVTGLAGLVLTAIALARQV